MHEIVLTRGRLLHAIEQIIRNAPLSVPVMVAAPGGKQFAFATALSGMELELLHSVPLDMTNTVVTLRAADHNLAFSTVLLWHRPFYCDWFVSKRKLTDIWDADEPRCSPLAWPTTIGCSENVTIGEECGLDERR